MDRRELLTTLAGGTAALSVADPHIGRAAPAGTNAAAGSALERDGLKFWSETSLKRVYPNSEPGSAEPLTLVSARNAQLSFQSCFRSVGDRTFRIRAEVEAPKGWSVQVRRVGYVPMQQLDTDVPLDEIDGVGHVPGLVPDPLYPETTADVGPASNGAFWITLKVPVDASVGRHEVAVTVSCVDEYRFTSWQGAKPWSVTLPVVVDVKPLVLKPRTDFPVTHWLSADSIWEYYKIEPFSERFWELADAYIADLTAHNLNVVYSPIFNARHEILERPA
ncbi:MAG TPA: glycoside hydrolase domain-containing protein, partial [Lacipirellula sp.]